MNIYIRKQNIDLFKYLSDDSVAILTQQLVSQSIKARETVFDCGDKLDYIVILQQGELESISPGGNEVGKIFPGEISGEASFLVASDAPFTLRALRDSQILKISFRDLDSFIAANPENGARIHAAINDTLCQKIIRITHKGEEHAEA